MKKLLGLTLALLLIPVILFAAITDDYPPGDGCKIKISGSGTNTLITADKITIYGILWYKPTTIGHLLEFTDDRDGDASTTGAVIMMFYCDTADESQYIQFPKGIKVKGLTCTDMDSGTVFVYIKH